MRFLTFVDSVLLANMQSKTWETTKFTFVHDRDVECHIANLAITKWKRKATDKLMPIETKKVIVTGLLESERKNQDEADQKEISTQAAGQQSLSVNESSQKRPTRQRKSRKSVIHEGEHIGPADDYFQQRHTTARTSDHTLIESGLPTGKVRFA